MLFTGIMLTSSGPKLLEYNTRFGDPETQSMIPLLSQDTDLAEVLLACTEGRLNQVNISVTPGFACNVVVAVQGYPDSYYQGDLVEFEETPDGRRIISVRQFFEDTLTRCSFRSPDFPRWNEAD